MAGNIHQPPYPGARQGLTDRFRPRPGRVDHGDVRLRQHQFFRHQVQGLRADIVQAIARGVAGYPLRHAGIAFKRVDDPGPDGQWQAEVADT